VRGKTKVTLNHSESHFFGFNPTIDISIPLLTIQSHSLQTNPTISSLYLPSHYYSSCIYPTDTCLSQRRCRRTESRPARFGNPHALASLSEPIEVRLAAEPPSQATFEVSVRPLSNVPATEAKALVSIVSALSPSLIFSRNPRMLVQLVAQALSPSRGRGDGSGMLAAMINAATLAFLNGDPYR